MSDFISETNHLPKELPEKSEKSSCDDERLSGQKLTFDATNRNGSKIFGFLSVGIFAIFIIVLIPFFMGDSSIAHCIMGFWFPIVLFSFFIVFFLVSIARQVILDSNVMIINGYGWSKRLKYESVAKIYHQLGSPNILSSHDDLLRLLDRKGKVLGQIPTTITDFIIFETELLRRVQNVTGKQIYSHEGELIEKRRDRKRRQRLIAFLGGIGILAICVNFILICFFTEPNNDVSIEATITHLSDEGGFHILKYVFTVDGKEYSGNEICDDQELTNLKGKKTVIIRYLPNDPNKHYLAYSDRSKIKYLVGLLMALCGFGGIFVFFGFLGYDFKTYKGITYLLKPGQILEDRLDELTQHSNKCSDKQ